MKKYLVGGAVRDSLLKIPVKDKDWVVVGATPSMLLEQGYQQIGRDFPVFLHPKSKEEYALARMEKKISNGYTGFYTWFSPDITLEQDLKRRDLTINAIAQDKNGNYVDPYNGRKDLENRLLRHVSDAFVEDPLRILRVARFAARYAHLHFRIFDKTMTLMQKMVSRGELVNLSAERIWKETENALQERDPQIYFQVLRKCGALSILFPEIDNLFGIPTLAKWHLEIDTGIHTLMTVSIAAKLTKESSVRFAALCHDVGKAMTPSEKWPNHIGHGQAGIPLVKNICRRLRVPNAFRDLSMLVTALHDEVHTIKNQSVEHLIMLFNRIDAWRKPQRVNQLIEASEADARGQIGLENAPYPQGAYIREAFQVSQSVLTESIYKKNLRGVLVREELIRLRCSAVEKWRAESALKHHTRKKIESKF